MRYAISTTLRRALCVLLAVASFTGGLAASQTASAAPGAVRAPAGVSGASRHPEAAQALLRRAERKRQRDVDAALRYIAAERHRRILAAIQRILNSPEWKAWIEAVRRSQNPPTPCPSWSGGCLLGGRKAVLPCALPVHPRRGDICFAESNYIVDVTNSRSTASGKYQFLNSTWAGHRGYARAGLAPEWVQDEKARLLWDNGRGCSHWAAC